jgi:DNA-binding NarL/FixJ family response regulator
MDIAIVGEAESAGSDTVDAICSAETDVAILDIKLKRGTGIDLCRQVKDRRPATGVILLSAYWDQALIRRALDVKTDAYVLKDAERFDLVRTIACVASGGTFFDPSIASAVVRQVQEDRTPISERDAAVLSLVARGRTNREIAAELFLSPHTVRDRLSQLMALLEARNRTEAAQIAVRRGLISH